MPQNRSHKKKEKKSDRQVLWENVLYIHQII